MGEDAGDEAVEGGVIAGVVFFGFDFAKELLVDDEAEGIGAGDDGGGAAFVGDGGEFSEDFAWGVEGGEDFVIFDDLEGAGEEDEDAGVFLAIADHFVADIGLDEVAGVEDVVEVAALEGLEEGDLVEGIGEGTFFVDVGEFFHGAVSV